jgi:hypothetical protein
MDCKKARRLAELHANREGASDASLQAHLAGCVECRAAAEAAAVLESRLVASVRPAEPRAGFEQRVSRRLERRLQRVAATGAARKWQPAWVFAAGIAGGLLLGMRLFVVKTGPPPSAVTRLLAETPASVGSVVAGAASIEVLSPNGGVVSPNGGVVSPNAGTGRQRDPAHLKPDSTVWVAREGTAEVALPNGGRVWLERDSVVRFGKDGVVLYRGAVQLSVRRGEQPFTVELPQGYVLTDEAEFRVRLDKGSSKARVEMLTGIAWLGNQAGAVAVAEGENAEVRASSAPAVSAT